MLKDVMDRSPAHRKTAQFCLQSLKAADFEKGSLTLENDETEHFFDPFKTRLIDS